MKVCPAEITLSYVQCNNYSMFVIHNTTSRYSLTDGGIDFSLATSDLVFNVAHTIRGHVVCFNMLLRNIASILVSF